MCRSVLHLALRLVAALVHSPPPLPWPAGSLSGAADVPGLLGDSQLNFKEFHAPTTPTWSRPLQRSGCFLAVLPGVPRVVSKTLTALCAFFFPLFTCSISYVNYRVSGSESRNSIAWKDEY